MRHKTMRPLALLALVLAMMLLTVASVGCGGDEAASTGGSPAAAPAADLTAEEIVAKGDAAMTDITSAAMTADFSMAVEGDPAKMTDPSAAQLAQSPITLRVEGKESTDPVALDMSMNVGLMGQTLDMGVLADGDKAWVEYQGKYYEIDQKNTEGITQSAGSGLSPMDQLKQQGLDVDKWGLTYELLGVEDVNGTQAYHISAQMDPEEMVKDLLKQLKSGDLAGQLGDPATAKQLEQALAENQKQIDELAKSLSGIGGDYWYAVDTFYLVKATMNATLDTKGQKDMQGVDSVAIEFAMTMSDFNEPVTVEPPAKSLPFDQLMDQMFGGMMGGSTFGT